MLVASTIYFGLRAEAAFASLSLFLATAMIRFKINWISLLILILIQNEEHVQTQIFASQKEMSFWTGRGILIGLFTNSWV